MCGGGDIKVPNKMLGMHLLGADKQKLGNELCAVKTNVKFTFQ